MAIEIPTIDIDRDPAIVGSDIDQTLREVGFFQIVNHGIPTGIADTCWSVTRRFFDLPLADKLEVIRPAEGPYGYIPVAAESLAQSLDGKAPGDLKEIFNIGPITAPTHELLDDGEAQQFMPNLWPSALPELRPAWEDYYRAMLDLSGRLMSIFALGLKLPADYFAEKIDKSPSALRALNYPEQTAPPLDGQLRAGAHTDYGTLTILRQEVGQKGLQVRDEGGAWIDVPAVEGAFVINIGDLMARWTNDRWRSTLHRVINPDTDSSVSHRRQSMPFFHNANYAAPVEALPSCLAAGESPKYERVLAGPHLWEKFTKTAVTA